MKTQKYRENTKGFCRNKYPSFLSNKTPTYFYIHGSSNKSESLFTVKTLGHKTFTLDLKYASYSKH